MTFSATRLNEDLRTRLFYKIDYYRKIKILSCMTEFAAMRFIFTPETRQEMNE